MRDRFNRGVDGRASALEQLRKAREGGGRRSDTYRVEEAGAVYDVVDEEQYETALADRRRLARSFMERDTEEGDGGVGCTDEEDDVVLGGVDDEGAREWRRRSRVVAKSRARKITASCQRREQAARPEKRQAKLILFGGRGVATTTAAPRLPSGEGEKPIGRVFHGGGGGGGTKSLVDELVTDDRALDDEMEEEDEESTWAIAATPGTSARDAQWPPAAATFTPALGDSAGRCAAVLAGLDARETTTPGASGTPQTSYRSTETPMSTADGETGAAAGLLPPEDSLDGPLGALVDATPESCTTPPSKPGTTAASPMVWPVAPPATACEAEACTEAVAGARPGIRHRQAPTAYPCQVRTGVRSSDRHAARGVFPAASIRFARASRCADRHARAGDAARRRRRQRLCIRRGEAAAGGPRCRRVPRQGRAPVVRYGGARSAARRQHRLLAGDVPGAPSTVAGALGRAHLLAGVRLRHSAERAPGVREPHHGTVLGARVGRHRGHRPVVLWPLLSGARAEPSAAAR
eukprot:ctg_1006.g213